VSHPPRTMFLVSIERKEALKLARRAQKGQTYRLPSGEWAYRYRTPDGKRPHVGGFKTEREARRELRKVLEELDEQREREASGSLERPQMPLGDLIEEYLDQYDKSERTKRKLTTLLKHAEPLREATLSELTPSQLNLLRAKFPTDSLRWNAFRSLRQVLNSAEGLGYVNGGRSEHA